MSRFQFILFFLSLEQCILDIVASIELIRNEYFPVLYHSEANMFGVLIVGWIKKMLPWALGSFLSRTFSVMKRIIHCSTFTNNLLHTLKRTLHSFTDYH